MITNPSKDLEISGYSKTEVVNRVARLVLDDGKWEAIHKLKTRMNSSYQTIYYITVRRKEAENENTNNYA